MQKSQIFESHLQRVRLLLPLPGENETVPPLSLSPSPVCGNAPVGGEGRCGRRGPDRFKSLLKDHMR